jgi:hypothetical protein
VPSAQRATFAHQARRVFGAALAEAATATYPSGRTRKNITSASDQVRVALAFIARRRRHFDDLDRHARGGYRIGHVLEVDFVRAFAPASFGVYRIRRPGLAAPQLISDRSAAPARAATSPGERRSCAGALFLPPLSAGQSERRNHRRQRAPARPLVQWRLAFRAGNLLPGPASNRAVQISTGGTHGA